MKKRNELFGRISAADFLKRYWQKKPLLVRGAFSEFPALLDPDELAGLSCEPEVVSRIIIEKGGKNPWQLLRGPFSRRTFSRLPKSHWTLLVNGVDRLVPSVHRLLDEFRFVPHWRIDDVMISYASKGGGVGAHVDNYDVFLIQALGKREWQIETEAVYDDDFIPGRAVRQLKKFKPDRKWILEPGDMLYLPPRFPHNGISRSSGCMTYSIGFRAPSKGELFDAMAAEVLSRLDEQEYYTDPDRRLQPSGEISAADLRRVKQMLRQSLLSDTELARWFGRFTTEPKDEEGEIPPDETLTLVSLMNRLSEETLFVRNEGVRMAYTIVGKKVFLFVNGSEYALPSASARLLELLTGSVAVAAADVLCLLRTAAEKKMLLELFNLGSFYFLE
jgi:50S ribosomal protein L16 3-hydroxylase